jgi:hypothetical protein
LLQTGQIPGKSPDSQIQVPHDDAAGLRVVAFSGVFRLNRPDDASCGFLAEDRQCRTKTEGAVVVGSSARLCENSFFDPSKPPELFSV